MKPVVYAAAVLAIAVVAFVAFRETPQESAALAAIPGIADQMKNYDDCAFHLKMAHAEEAMFDKGKVYDRLEAALVDYLVAYHRAEAPPYCNSDEVRGAIAAFFKRHAEAMGLPALKDNDIDTMIDKSRALHERLSQYMAQIIALHNEFAARTDGADAARRKMGEAARLYLEGVFEAGVGKKEVKNPQSGKRTVIKPETYITILNGLKSYGILRIDDHTREGSLYPYWQINSMEQAKFFADSPRFVAGLSYLSAVD